MQTLISVQNLTIGYHRKMICQNIDFSIKQGSVLCILGANGEGKSTLLKTLLGLLPPLSGKIFLNSCEISSLNLQERAKVLSYVPQNMQIGFAFSVLQMVTMGKAGQMSIFAHPNQRDEQQARTILDQLNILHLAKQDYASLSGGQRQLVLIARALMQNAQAIILDEPTASLDFYNQSHVIQLLGALKHQGRTIIFTTHHPDQAFDIADDVLMIKDNNMLCCGKTHDVMNETMLTNLYKAPIGIIEVEGKKISFIKNNHQIKQR